MSDVEAYIDLQNRSAHRVSAGLLMFRGPANQVDVFLVHPGGPYFQNRDHGFWSIPKGLIEDGEEALGAAVREFEEETSIRPQGPYIPLREIQQRSGKIVHAWAFEGDWSPADGIESNLIEIEWPPRSGQTRAIPEVDEAAFFTLEEAHQKISQPQRAFLERLAHALDPTPGGGTHGDGARPSCP